MAAPDSNSAETLTLKKLKKQFVFGYRCRASNVVGTMITVCKVLPAAFTVATSSLDLFQL